MKRWRLGRRGKVMRNTLLALLCGFATWIGMGAPLFSTEGEFQRLQRENLMTEKAPLEGSYLEGEGRSREQIALGANDAYLVYANLTRGDLSLWPRQGEGPVLAPDPGAYGEIGSSGPFGGWLLAAGAPEGTVRAEVTVALSCWYKMEGDDRRRAVELFRDRDQKWALDGEPTHWEKTWHIQGERLGDGAFRFWLEAENPYRGHIEIYAVREAMNWGLYQGDNYRERVPVGGHMTAAFYDESGAELGRAELETTDF